MTGFVLSIGWALAAAIATLVMLHLRRVTRRVRLMGWLGLLGLVGFVAHYLLIHPCPTQALRVGWGLEFVNGLYFYLFGFIGVFLQIYGLADRGFSLAMLTDLNRAHPRAMTREALKQTYADGKGLTYVSHKRMHQLTHGGFIRTEGNTVRATRLGAAIGRVCVALRRLYVTGTR